MYSVLLIRESIKSGEPTSRPASLMAATSLLSRSRVALILPLVLTLIHDRTFLRIAWPSALRGDLLVTLSAISTIYPRRPAPRVAGGVQWDPNAGWTSCRRRFPPPNPLIRCCFRSPHVGSSWKWWKWWVPLRGPPAPDAKRCAIAHPTPSGLRVRPHAREPPNRARRDACAGCGR